MLRRLAPFIPLPGRDGVESHPARKAEAIVARLDLSAVEAKRSSLGRRGFEPRRLLAVWVYASWRGVHHSTKLEHLLKTDLACRYLSGGHTISAGVLRQFRRENGEAFAAAIQQTVELAVEADLIPLAGADAEPLAKRLQELTSRPVEEMTPDERQKHRAAVERCRGEG